MGVRKTGRPTGRTPADMRWEEVDAMIEAGVPGTEVSKVLGIHEDTLYRRVREEMGMTFTEYYQEMRSKGNRKLHTAQFDAAIEGNVSMLQWLGKWRLGQKDEDKEPPPPSRQEGAAETAMIAGCFDALVKNGLSRGDAIDLIGDVLAMLPVNTQAFRDALICDLQELS